MKPNLRPLRRKSRALRICSTIGSMGLVAQFTTFESSSKVRSRRNSSALRRLRRFWWERRRNLVGGTTSLPPLFRGRLP